MAHSCTIGYGDRGRRCDIKKVRIGRELAQKVPKLDLGNICLFGEEKYAATSRGPKSSKFQADG